MNPRIILVNYDGSEVSRNNSIFPDYLIWINRIIPTSLLAYTDETITDPKYL